jgi:hypothetical protein
MALVEAFGLFAAGHDEVVVLIAEEAAPRPLSSVDYAAMGIGLVLRRDPAPSCPRIGPPRWAESEVAPIFPEPASELAESPISDVLRLLWAHDAAMRVLIPLGADIAVSTSETRWVLDYHPAETP